ncbi:hypothetical protein E4U21_007874 [Claviceps maximensis]|nr:hypothetical protein E4U21_007874 [Claviceps maximensis]
MKHVLAPLALLAARATLPEPEAGDSAHGCAGQGLYIISVRGTGEDPGIGVSGTIIGSQVQKRIKGTKIVALDYPATFSDPYYMESVSDGTKGLTKLINDHVISCPKDKIAILGYSQGAQVALDTICGTDESGFENTAGLASDTVEKHIVSIAVFGDPTYNANVVYDKGTSKTNGLFPRKNTDGCLKYANMISSWCDTGDIYCAGGDSAAVHGQYFQKYGTDIVKFIVERASPASSANASASASTSSALPAGTAVPTSSRTSAGPPSGSHSTTTGAPTATTTTETTSLAANGLIMASKRLYVALPLVLVAMFQML